MLLLPKTISPPPGIQGNWNEIMPKPQTTGLVGLGLGPTQNLKFFWLQTSQVFG